MTPDVEARALAVLVTADRPDLPYMTRSRSGRGGVLVARTARGVRVGSIVVKPVMALELSEAIYAVTAGPKPRTWARVTSGPKGTTITIRREGDLIRVSGTLYEIEAAFEFAAALARAVQDPVGPPE